MARPVHHVERTGFFETKITRSPISKFREFVVHFVLSVSDGRYSLNHLVENIFNAA